MELPQSLLLRLVSRWNRHTFTDMEARREKDLMGLSEPLTATAETLRANRTRRALTLRDGRSGFTGWLRGTS